MINPYDKANELGQALKSSKEYLEYIEAKNKILADDNNKEILKDFQKKQQEIQMMAINGKEVAPEKMAKIQDMYKVLVENPQIKEYFDIEVRFNVMLADINKIIAESVKDALV